MRRVKSFISFGSVLAVATLSLSALVACSSDGGGDDGGGSGGGSGGGTAGPFAYCGPADSGATCPVTVDASALPADVQFRRDVLPIFERNCNSSICHGATMAADLYLGLAASEGPTPDDVATTVVTSLKAPSQTAAAVNNVEPGNPENSFLMLKVDGCQNSVGLSCVDVADKYNFCSDNACGDSMPLVGEPDFPLSADDRNTIRAWIAQGALDN